MTWRTPDEKDDKSNDLGRINQFSQKMTRTDDEVGSAEQVQWRIRWG